MIIKDESYIYSIVTPYGEEEKEIHELCKNPPTATEGYEYKLTVNKAWELCKVPVSTEDTHVDDAIAALKAELQG